jgi:SAM-dependent methyltransferase
MDPNPALTPRMRAAYDVVAADFEARNAQMPRAVAAAAERFARGLPAGARVVDLGCGPGRDMAWLHARGLRVAGLDLSAGMLRQARPRASGALVQGEMRGLPFGAGTCQGVWCNAALLHLPKAEAPAALAEIARVLAPGGLAFVSVQAGSGEGWEADSMRPGLWPPRYFARYDKAEFARLMEAAGLGVGEVAANPAGPRTWLWFLARRSRAGARAA